MSRPHFVTIGAHTINVTAITCMEDRVDKDSEEDPGERFLEVRFQSIGSAYLYGADRERLLAYLASDACVPEKDPNYPDLWDWRVLS